MTGKSRTLIEKFCTRLVLSARPRLRDKDMGENGPKVLYNAYISRVFIFANLHALRVS
jgi:hypothetical protein